MEDRLKEILHMAMTYRAPDIHFTVQNDTDIRIGMRVHGRLMNIPSRPSDISFLHYLMYRSNLDVADTMDPQTGAFEQETDGVILSLRFAYVESYHLVSAVLRILNLSSGIHSSSLAFDPEDTEWLQSVTHHRSGLYVFSGPTGSGKTTTLYTLLNECHGKSIYTLEDPIEIFNEKYVQIQINDRQHLSYGEGIKQLMRHNPDIIMIGEIRDEEAAVNAVRAALTGSLVLTSIHSFTCINAIHRLLDLNVNAEQLRDVAGGIACQRLYDTVFGIRGIYEIMDRKEVQYWFENHHTSPSHISLGQKISAAMRSGILSQNPVQTCPSERG